MQVEDNINSDAYWSRRFEGNWEFFQGPAQSQLFEHIAINNLPL